MKLRLFKKNFSHKEIRLKNNKHKQKLTNKNSKIEDLFSDENIDIDPSKVKSELINLLKKIKSENKRYIESEEDLNKASKLLFKIPSLQKFYNEYSINEKTLKEILNLSEIIDSYKGQCLFLQDENPSEMFIFLEGELSLKYSKKIHQEVTLDPYIINEFNIDDLHNKFKTIKINNFIDTIIKRRTFRKPAIKSSTKDYDYSITKMILATPRKFHIEFYKENEEIEYMKINTERFISQNNLLTFTPHSIDCYVSSDESIILSLDRKSFNSSFNKNVNFVDVEYKKFISNRIKVFSKLMNETLNVYFYSWVKIFPHLNEEIYHVGDEAKYFYLLYSGECLNIFNDNSINIFTKGSFIGLDSLFCPSRKYLNTVVCKSNHSILFRFNITFFNDFILKALKSELEKYYNIKKEVSKFSIVKKESILKNFKERYKNLVQVIKNNKKKNKNINDLDLSDSNPFDTVVQSEKEKRFQTIQNYNKLTQKNIFISTKNIRNKVIKKNKTNPHLISMKLTRKNNSTKYLQLKNKQITINKLNLFSTSPKTNKRPLTCKNIKNKLKLNILYKSQYPKKDQTKFYNSKTLSSNKRNTNKEKSINKFLKTSYDSDNNTLYTSYREPVILRNSYYENSSIYNDINIISLTDKGKNPIFFQKLPNDYKKTLNEKVDLSIEKWIKTVNDSKKVFKTAHYNLPLFSSIEDNSY